MTGCPACTDYDAGDACVRSCDHYADPQAPGAHITICEATA